MSDTLPPLDSIDSTTSITALRSQYPDGLLGVPGGGLRLSWQARSDDPAARQLGFQVRWSGEEDGGTDPIAGSDAIGVPAPGGALGSGEVRRYAVRIATANGWTEWGPVLEVEAALAPEDFTAAAIGGESPLAGRSPLLRTTFDLPAAPVRARLRATSLGVSELRLNGAKVSDEHLSPGWTAYQGRIVVATWDVTDLLSEGRNAIGGSLGDGWYRGRLGWMDRDRHYGDDLALIAQLDVELADGSTVRVTTGPDWRTAGGPVTASSIYDGTDIDLRLVESGWDTADFDDGSWQPVREIEVDRGLLEPRITGGVRTVAEFEMSQEQHDDRVQLDAGQNIAGWVRLVVEGTAGDTVTVRHAEVLEPDGTLHTRSLRGARASDVYILAEDGRTTLEPPFTFHGFRYADVTGARVVTATAVAISSADVPRGSFESSHAALNRLHENVAWSQRDNFVSVPTDCPQRDERLGWTGDAQAFAPTANTLFDVEAFWMSWLRDLELDQDETGSVAAVVPNIVHDGDFQDHGRGISIMGKAGWADAATMVPWATYLTVGSTEVLERQLGSMRRWVDSLTARATDGGLLPTVFQFGDWLDPDAPGDEPWAAKVSSDFVANAFYAHSARLLSRTESLVGDPDRAERYGSLASQVAAATWERWGEHAVTTQSGCAIALEFRIAPDAERERVGAALADLVRSEDGRISTGFLGTPLVLDALVDTGHVDEAYRMLLRREAPSWLYQVDMGATTIWERWDALRPDGSIHPGDMATDEGGQMLSFNHYAYGAVIDWVYRVVAGLAPVPEHPGYRVVRVAPRPSAAVDSVRASIETRLGRLAIDWRLDGDRFEARLTIPVGSTALLDLPTTPESTVTVNGAALDGLELGHGEHTITVTAPAVADPLTPSTPSDEEALSR
ncbi:alpha-L-rhamnosidase [Naasia sp. SYSU D00057]|uniref:alpha-L-rhamnosidase n=1 Tax=Naasia sp. SYSU D00057 TaxID=2817380 RepID=UPI001B315685|nr:alpha-L-rhamnosidase [Naasia sp. SYSU D00057]